MSGNVLALKKRRCVYGAVLKNSPPQFSTLSRHPTLHDVARECGVSAMTVSRVLGGRDGVGEQTRRKVLTAARRMHYHPSALAINFARNRSGFIGVATHFEGLLGSYYFRNIMAGFQVALHGKHTDFALFDTISEVFEKPEELAKLYRQRKTDGLLIVAPHQDDKYLKTLSRLGVAFVVVGECVNDKSVPSVSCDDGQGVRLLCRHLRKLGHRDIAYIAGADYLGSARRRRKAFVEFMRDEGISIPKHFIQPGFYTADAGRSATLRILEAKRRPTAIVAANDHAAVGVLEALRERGIRVPEEISVAGFDDLLPAAVTNVTLTTVRQPLLEIGRAGAEILLKAIDTGQLAVGHTDVPVTLVTRDSTARVTSATAKNS
ncbi:MAG: LacI family DNA-binding transcriptional regulator [Chthoniobacterales bacterium]